jgi:hypothetical protein
MKAWKELLREEGSFPILAIIMIGLLIFTGLAFMKWGADESWEARFEKAKLQAYYAAHAGLMDQGYNYLRTRKANEMTVGIWDQAGGTDVKTANNDQVATATTWARGVSLNTGGTGLADFNFVEVKSVGAVDFQVGDDEMATVKDSVTMVVKMLNVSNFLYLTNIETTMWGEVIKFFYLDTLNGWVHSNDTIALQGGGPPGGPVFFNRVSTTAPIFNYWGNVTPYFAYPPMFNYREIKLPETAVDVRAAAHAAGSYFPDDGSQWAFRLKFYANGSAKLFRWPLGLPPDTTITGQHASWGGFNWGAIFVDGYLEMEGLVNGVVTVGAHGSTDPADTGYHCIRLINDVRYHNSSPIDGFYVDTLQRSLLGIISESDIVVGNTWANGKNNGWNRTNHNPDSSTIIVTGALVALGESFTFEDQNDNPNLWEYSRTFVGTTPDRRGEIFIRGALTQYRRGYVHRSTHGDTGYGKHYIYDRRLDKIAPPYFIQATDATGAAHYEIISWGNR